MFLPFAIASAVEVALPVIDTAQTLWSMSLKKKAGPVQPGLVYV